MSLVLRKVAREDFVIGNVYLDIEDPLENGLSEGFYYVGKHRLASGDEYHFMYPISKTGYPAVEDDGTLAFGLNGSCFYEEVE